MIRIYIPAAAALAVLIAACSPAPDTAPQAASPEETAAPETAAPEPAMAEAPAPEAAPSDAALLDGAAGPDAAALHVLLVENGDDLVPSDWNTGEPVSETSLVYWMLPALDVEAERSAACTPLSEPARAQDCTLSFVAPSQEAGRPAVEARFRLSVAEGPDGQLILLSPNVRWAVTG
jgi:hypothetical protein